MAIYKAKGYITFVFSASKDGTANLTSTTRTIDDMVKTINKFVELDPKLTKDERNILSAGYKNIISNKRASWRLLNSMQKKEEKKNSNQIANIMSGKEFLENVLDGNFIDYDGSIAKIYVDGFESNLGLCAGGICQGKLLVNEVVWRDLCKAHKIEVDWANK